LTAISDFPLPYAPMKTVIRAGGVCAKKLSASDTAGKSGGASGIFSADADCEDSLLD